MDITTRNFFRLLRAGAFDAQEQIEPMSAWKWQQVFRHALMHNVAALLWDGVEKCSDQYFMQLPDTLVQSWREHAGLVEEASRRQDELTEELMRAYDQLHVRPMLMLGTGMAQLYERPHHRADSTIQVFLPFGTQGHKADEWALQNGERLSDSSKLLSFEWKGTRVENHHRLIQLTNQLHQRTLQNIVEQNVRQNQATFINIKGTRVETLSPTLSVLLMLMRAARSILNEGISLKLVVDLGVFLRRRGDRVDFVTLQEWIDRLALQRSANLVASLLMGLLGFGADELPFATPNADKDIRRMMKDLFSQRTSTDDLCFKQGSDVFVHAANSSALFSHIHHSARYFSYYPSESITNFFAVFAHSLSHIEE